MAQGSHVVCMERFDPREWLALVQQYQVDYAYMVPTMMTRIAKLPEAITRAANLSTITTLLHMAAPRPPDIKRWWIDRIGADHVWEVYGGTERVGVTRIGRAGMAGASIFRWMRRFGAADYHRRGRWRPSRTWRSGRNPFPQIRRRRGKLCLYRLTKPQGWWHRRVWRHGLAR